LQVWVAAAGIANSFFEYHYIDGATRQVSAVVGADLDVARTNGRWVITVSATPILSP